MGKDPRVRTVEGEVSRQKEDPCRGDGMRHCCGWWVILCHLTEVGIKIPILSWGDVAQSVELETRA